MSKDYLTQTQALQKAGNTGSVSNQFSTKKWLVSEGVFDTSKLTKYQDNDFVVDDDIIESYYTYKIQFLQIYVSPATNTAETLSYKNSTAQYNNKYKGIFQLQAKDGGVFYSDIYDCEPSHSGNVPPGGFEFQDMTIKISKDVMSRIESFVAMGVTVWTEDTYVVMKGGTEVSGILSGIMYYNSSQRIGNSSTKTLEINKYPTPWLKWYLMNTVPSVQLSNAKFGFVIPLYGNGKVTYYNVGTTFMNSIGKTGYNFGDISATILLTERDRI